MKTFNEHYRLPVKVESYGHVFDADSNMALEMDYKNPERMDAVVRLINGGATDYKFALPVKYEPTKIINAHNEVIITIRGWGRLQKLKDGDKIQDAIGNEIAELINNLKGH